MAPWGLTPDDCDVDLQDESAMCVESAPLCGASDGEHELLLWLCEKAGQK